MRKQDLPPSSESHPHNVEHCVGVLLTQRFCSSILAPVKVLLQLLLKNIQKGKNIRADSACLTRIHSGSSHEVLQVSIVETINIAMQMTASSTNSDFRQLNLCKHNQNVKLRKWLKTKNFRLESQSHFRISSNYYPPPTS